MVILINHPIQINRLIQSNLKASIRQMSIRRNTQQLPISMARNIKERKIVHMQRWIAISPRNYRNNQSIASRHTCNRIMQSRTFLDQVLLSQLQAEIQRREMKKIVRQTMDHCENFLNYQNWQINPVAPFNEKLNQSTIKLDQEPKIKSFDPLLGFDRKKTYKQMKVQDSVFKFNINVQVQKCSLEIEKAQQFKANESSKSIISNRSLSSRKSTAITELIPLRLESDRISQISSKRNLQDFLRDKKLNKQYGMGMNLGQRLHGMFQEKQNYLKTIKQFQKTPNYNKTSKNLMLQASLTTKLPILLFKDEFATDYNGQSISMKKQSKLKKGIEVLKTGFKIMQNVENLRSQRKLQTKIQVIKLKPLAKTKQQVDGVRLLDQRSYLEQSAGRN